MKILLISSFLFVSSLLSTALFAQDTPEATAVAANDRAYEAAHAKGDAAALAAFFEESAKYTTDSGKIFYGREEILAALKSGLVTNKGSSIAIETDSVEKLSDEVVLQKGLTRFTNSAGEIDDTLFTAIHVKKDGQWKIRDLTETPAPQAGSDVMLQQLAWLIGKWEEKDETAGVNVISEYLWARNGKFITRNISVTRDSEILLEGWQIIGWDPASESFRSWTFDGEGGFAEATWSQDGKRWLCREIGTTPDGAITTSEQTWTREGEDLVQWESNNRTRDGEPLPSISRITLKRVKGN